MQVHPDAFRQALAQFASGVTVVTSAEAAQPCGMTVSAFSAVSADPPLVLVCLDASARTRPVIERTGSFAVHILSSQQIQLGKRFAGMLPEVSDPFTGIDWATAATGAPVLPGCVAWLDCRVYAVHVAGDHSIIIGEVWAAEVDRSLQPIVYHDRQWKQLA